MYAQERHVLECSCMGARNKMLLKRVLVFEKNALEQSLERLKDERGDITAMEAPDEYSRNYRISKISLIDNQIEVVNDELDHVRGLFSKISDIEVCGE